MKLPRCSAFALLGFASALITVAQSAPASTRRPEEDLNDPALRARAGLVPGQNLLHTGWGVTPAGTHTRVNGDMPLKLVISPDKKTLAAVSGGFSDTGLTLIELATQKVSQFLPLKASWNGVAFSRDGKRIFVSGGDTGTLHVFDYANGKATPAPDVHPMPTEGAAVFLAGIAVHPSTGKVYVCNEGNHEVWVLNPGTLALEAVVPVGLHPHSCAFGGDNRHLYVTNWGSRTVSAIDTQTHRRVRDITVGLRPNDLALAPDGRLFVACSGDNSVHVITTGKLEKLGETASPARRLWEGTREVISTALYPGDLEGSTPSGVAVSPDGRTLFVANSDNNNVVVVDISNRLHEEARERGDMISIVEGFIPVGWYPTAVAVSPDNQTLFVANGKGLMSRANVPARTSDPRKANTFVPYDYNARIFEGSISAIRRPDAAQMAAYTAQVRRNSPYTPASFTHAPMPSQSIIPAQVGDPCPIKHVLYIIKENRTYDQVLGDMKDAQGRPVGNGDPNLAIFGEKVTPNHHQIARDFVLLDNLYSNSEVSVDGHSWCDAAIATDFNQRSWIVSYSKHGKLPGNEEMENPANGYLWDLCRRHGVSYKNYGEGAQRVPSQNRGRWTKAGARDMDLVDFWIADLKKAEQTGDLPRFTIMSLGENHTKGTTPGEFTPGACVASNDIGLGKIVAAAMRSKFWPEMAIFVIEDDTQNGPDHVDAHRTIGFVISPYVKRGSIDSTLYTTASFVRTIELILGLPPLTQYDAAATPMFACFGREPAAAQPYDVLKPEVDLYAKNTKQSAFWRESSRMNFKDYDRAPEDELNRILWYVAKGDTPYPTPIHGAVFTR